MSKIKSLISDLQEEILKSPAALQEVLEFGHSLIEVFPVAAKLRPVQQFHLLEGLLYAQPEQFLKRMGEAGHEKEALADYCYENSDLASEAKRFLAGQTNGARKLFFESGSTIAYLIGHFAEHLSDAQNRLQMLAKENHGDGDVRLLKSSVITNNFTGLTALAGLVDHLEPVQGRLSLKYFGFFPFSDNEHQIIYQEEAKRYNNLAEAIESCDSVFATCSSFSFLAGPIVGLRPNCLTKRAMYSGADRWGDSQGRNFYLLFHFKKLVPLLSRQKSFEFEPPREHCGCVFLPCCNSDKVATKPLRVAAAIDEWIRNHSDDDVVHSDFSKSWHGEWRDLHHGRHHYHKIRVPLEEFIRGIADHRVRIPYNLDRSWLDWLNSSNGTNILVSLPDEATKEALDFIKQELKRVNLIVRKADYKYQFKIHNEQNAEKQHVAHLVVEKIA